MRTVCFNFTCLKTWKNKLNSLHSLQSEEHMNHICVFWFIPHVLSLAIFILAIAIYLFPEMKGDCAQSWKKDKLAPWGFVILDENNCQVEDLQHFNDFKIVNMCLHTSEWHLWWVNSVRWWQVELRCYKQASSDEVCWWGEWQLRQSSDSIHDNTLSWTFVPK